MHLQPRLLSPNYSSDITECLNLDYECTRRTDSNDTLGHASLPLAFEMKRFATPKMRHRVISACSISHRDENQTAWVEDSIHYLPSFWQQVLPPSPILRVALMLAPPCPPKLSRESLGFCRSEMTCSKLGAAQALAT